MGKKKTYREQVDWKEAERLYVPCDLWTHADVAEKYGCSTRLVNEVAVEEKWSAKREAFLKENPDVAKKVERKKKKNVGRDGRTDIDWELAEQFYIMGELVTQKRDGTMTHKLPSFTDVGRRFRCSPQLVSYHSQKRKWKEKRVKYRRDAQTAVREEVAKARALTFGEAAGILDAWLVQFQEQLEKRAVRTDSLSDFNIAMRLKSFVEAQPVADGGEANALSLHGLQRKHAAARRRQNDASSDALAGVLAGDDDPVH